MLYFIELMRAVSSALITNSHFKGVYPNDILSFGGGLGAALFLMISGYLLTHIDSETKFSKWYVSKILRIYKPLLLFSLIRLIIGNVAVTSFHDLFQLFLLPPYWYIRAIIVFYALYYLFVKYVYNRYGNKSLYAAVLVLLLAFAVMYTFQSPICSFSIETLKTNDFSLENHYVIMQPIWMISMLLGLWIKKESSARKHVHSFIDIALAAFFVLIFLIVKLLMKRGITTFEFMLVVSYIGFAFSAFHFFMKSEAVCQKFSKTILGKLLLVVSSCTIEIYIIQFVLIQALKDIAFPINLVLLVTSIIAGAYALHVVSNFIFDHLMRLRVRRVSHGHT